MNYALPIPSLNTLHTLFALTLIPPIIFASSSHYHPTLLSYMLSLSNSFLHISLSVENHSMPRFQRYRSKNLFSLIISFIFALWPHDLSWSTLWLACHSLPFPLPSSIHSYLGIIPRWLNYPTFSNFTPLSLLHSYFYLTYTFLAGLQNHLLHLALSQK